MYVIYYTAHTKVFTRMFLTLNLAALLMSCKPTATATSSLAVDGDTIPLNTPEEVRNTIPGTYGVQFTFEDGSGDVKRQEATGTFVDQAGTTFMTNRHVAQVEPPPGYSLRSMEIVDAQKNTIQKIDGTTKRYTPIGNRESTDIALFGFPEGTNNLTQGTAAFAPEGYDLTKEKLKMGGFGMYNSQSNNPEYQTFRYGEVDPQNINNPGGHTFKIYAPENAAVSSPGDSGMTLRGSSGIVGINRGGQSDNSGRFSHVISPYGGAMKYILNDAKSQGFALDGWQPK